MSTLYIRYPSNSSVPSGAFPLLAPDGSAGAPSYSFAANPTYGMYSAPGSGLALAFAAAGNLAGGIGVGQLWLIGKPGNTGIHEVNGRLKLVGAGSAASAALQVNAVGYGLYDATGNGLPLAFAAAGSLAGGIASTAQWSIGTPGLTLSHDINGGLNITKALVVTQTVTASNLSGTNTGDITLAAVGSSPSANGASLAGQVLTLQPADGTTPGLLTAGAQTIGGAKTFSGAITASNLSGTNTGDQTITLTGNVTGTGTTSFATTIAAGVITNSMISSSAAIAITKLAAGTANQLIGTNSGATAEEFKSLAVGTAGTDFAIAHTANTITFNLPDASASNRGAVTTGTQTFAGDKTFSGTTSLQTTTTTTFTASTSLTVGSVQASYQNSMKGAWASKVGLIVWNTDTTGNSSGGLVVATSATSGTNDLLAAYNNAAGTRVFGVNNSGLVVIGTGTATTHQLNTTVATTATAGANGALPATVQGYVTININGTDRKIPYYAT